MSDRNSDQRSLWPQQDHISNLVKAIIESLLDELGLAIYFTDVDQSQLDFYEQLEQKLGFEHGDVDGLRRILADKVAAHLKQHSIEVSEEEQQQLLEGLLAELVGLGPLEPLLNDEAISHIMVNGPHTIFVKRRGKLEAVNFSFESVEHLMWIIDRIIEPLGGRVDESSPMVDARLADGSRVNAVIPPLSLTGPTLTIRKFPKQVLTFDDLLAWGTLDEDIATFLKTCVMARLNILVAGGVGSGKTTLLNVIASVIPPEERIVTVEDVAELRLPQKHVIALESRPPNIEGKGEVTIRELVINSLRMLPDRIVVGECRSGEVLELLQAMSTGHDGAMTTIFAYSPQQALERLEMIIELAGIKLTVPLLRSLISSAIDLVVQMDRLEDSSRKVVRVTEVLPVRGGEYDLRDVFLFLEEGYDKQGKVRGSFQARPVSTQLRRRMETLGINLPPELVAFTEEERG